jgi:hypothetical protein
MAAIEIYEHPGNSEVRKHFGFCKIKNNLPPNKSNLDVTKGLCPLCCKECKNTV